MTKLISLAALLTLSLVLAGATGGCQNKNKMQKNAAVTDINVSPIPPRESETAYAGPLNGAPAYYEPAAVTQTPGGAGGGFAPAAGGSYQVKKGDTLFSIAKATYGNGNQWQRIASANPGLAPNTLKAGQTIVLP